jgi:hypothetical protein
VALLRRSQAVADNRDTVCNRPGTADTVDTAVDPGIPGGVVVEGVAGMDRQPGPGIRPVGSIVVAVVIGPDIGFAQAEGLHVKGEPCRRGRTGYRRHCRHGRPGSRPAALPRNARTPTGLVSFVPRT